MNMDEEDDDDEFDWGKPQENFIGSPAKGPVKETPQYQTKTSCQIGNQNQNRSSTSDNRGIRHDSITGDINPPFKHPRVILHIDIDCFYAQVEMIRNPGLRNKPIGIQQKYIVVTCNYPARAYGVTKLMSIKDAKEKCPNLVLVNGEDLTHYRQMSYKISDYLQQYCLKVERLGFDENFLDLTELVSHRLTSQSQESLETVNGHVYGEEPSALDSCSCGCHERLKVGSHISADIREGLFRELGITCCGGVAHNKLLSKLVAGSHKPNQQTTLFPESTSILMGSLKSVRNIPGIGHSSSKQLHEMGVVSVRDLQYAELTLLKKVFGETVATHMKQLALGIDETPIVAFSLPQTLSDEDSFKRCSSIVETQNKIKQLLNSLLKRLLEDGRTPATLRLTVRKLSAANKYLNRESRQCHIPNTVFKNFSQERISQTSGQLQVLAMGLFNKLVNTKEPFHLTLINVAFAKLEEKSKSAITNFFSPKPAKDQEVVKSEKHSLESQSPAAGESEFSLKQEESGLNELDASSFKVDSLLHHVVSGVNKVDPGEKEFMNRTVKTEREMVKESDSTNSLTKWLSFGKKISENENGIYSNRYMDINRENVNTLVEIVDPVTDIESKESEVNDKFREDVSDPVDREISEALANKQNVKRKSIQTECTQNSELNSDNVQKRPRLSGNFDNMIPEHIDKSVFYELPPAIQQEILSSSKLEDTLARNERAVVDVNIATTSSKHNTGKQTLDGKTGFLNATSTARKDFIENHQEEICSSQTMALNASTSKTTQSHAGFFRSKTNSKLCVESVNKFGDEHCNSGKDMKAHFHKENMETSICDSNRLQNGSERICITNKSSCSSEKGVNDIFIPSDIDRETFLGLPTDIQQELVSEWKKKKVTKPSPTENQIPHFKMPDRSSRNSILSYFPKANR